MIFDNKMLDLRTSSSDNGQRLLNALEAGIIIPIHRNRGTFETMIMVRGALEEYFFVEQGSLTNSFFMQTGGDFLCV